LPMAWHLGTTHRLPWMRLLNRAYLLVAMLAITLTSSRGALILSAIALLIVPWTLPRLGLRTKVAMVIFLIASVTITWRFIPQRSLDRLATTRTEVMEGTMNERRVIWRAGLHLIPLHPLGGVGAGAFSRAVVPFLGYEKAPHNTFLSVLVEQGIVGLSLFALVVIFAFMHARHAAPSERRLLLILLLTLSIGLTPRAWEAEKQTWLILALLLAPAVTAHAAPVAAGAVRRQWLTRVPAGV
jgi:O-antigen ligase